MGIRAARIATVMLLTTALAACSGVFQDMASAPGMGSFALAGENPTRGDTASFEIRCQGAQSYALLRDDQNEDSADWKPCESRTAAFLASVPLQEGEQSFRLALANTARVGTRRGPTAESKAVRKRWIVRNATGSEVAPEGWQTLIASVPNTLSAEQARALADNIDLMKTTQIASLWSRTDMTDESRRYFARNLDELVSGRVSGRYATALYVWRALRLPGGLSEGLTIDLSNRDLTAELATLATPEQALHRLGFDSIQEMADTYFDGECSTLESCAAYTGYPDGTAMMTAFAGSPTRFTNAAWRGISFKNSRLDGLYLQNVHLSEADLEGVTMDGLNTMNVFFTGARNFDFAALRGAASTVGCSFRDMDVRGLDFSGRDFRGVDLRGATNIDWASFNNATSLVNANLSGLDVSLFDPSRQANISGMNFSDTTGLRVASLGAITSGANAKFTNVDFAGFVAPASLASWDLRGVRNLNAASLNSATTLTSLNLEGLDLASFDPTGKSVQGVNFSYATNLDGAKLAGATTFQSAKFRGVTITGFAPTGKSFASADLRDSSGFGPAMNGASATEYIDFSGANLTGWTGTTSGQMFTGTRWKGTTGVTAAVLNGSSVHMYMINFDGMDMTGFDANGHWIFDANFSGALNFTGAQLNGGGGRCRLNLTGVNMTGWNPPANGAPSFTSSGTCNGTYFTGSNFTNATNLTAAALKQSNDLRWMNLSGTGFTAADFAGYDLTGVTGLNP